MKFKYPFLLALLLVLAGVITLFAAGVISLPLAACLVIVFQLAMLSSDRRRPALFMAILSEAQIVEFDGLLKGLQSHEGLLKELPGRLSRLEKENDELRGSLKKMLRLGLKGAGPGIRTIGGKDFINDEAAQALASDFVLMLGRVPNALETMVRDSGSRQRLLDISAQTAGFATTKAALDATSTPLPTVYVPLVVELVWKYGQARQFATVYPLGAGTVKLPRLKAGEDDFAYLGVGTAGMSQPVAEKKVAAELVTFTANKGGGIIRIPMEIEEDTFIPLGQFLARYIARQLAKLEDKTLFLGDGTATYASQTGVGPYCVANNAYLRQLGAGKTKITDATINDFRLLRGQINAAALVDDAAYYMNPTMEGLLCTFNTIGQPLIYRPQNGTQPATLDGFPIRWVGILPAFSATAAPSSFITLFGALSYWYLGERGAPRIEISREVFFATDEIAMRALERIDVEAMAIDAMAALETAAA